MDADDDYIAYLVRLTASTDLPTREYAHQHLAKAGFRPSQPRSAATGRWVIPRQDEGTRKQPVDRREETAQLIQVAGRLASFQATKPTAQQHAAAVNSMLSGLNLPTGRDFNRLGAKRRAAAIRVMSAAQRVAALEQIASQSQELIDHLSGESKRPNVMPASSHLLVSRETAERQHLAAINQKLTQARAELVAARNAWKANKVSRPTYTKTATEVQP